MLVLPVRRFLGKSKWTSIDLPLHTIGRRMSWTQSGLFANLPEHAQPSDVVALAAGGRVPLV
jgi:hypothetical protein